MGTTVRAIRAALEYDGQPIEKAWPYLSTLPSDLAKWKPPAKVGALFRRKSKANATAFDDVWDAVEGNLPDRHDVIECFLRAGQGWHRRF